jgi:hypothetical protein
MAKTWQKRLVKEHSKLEEKMCKLDSFIGSGDDGFNKLKEVDQDLLLSQYAAMASYISVLEIRMKRAGLLELNRSEHELSVGSFEDFLNTILPEAFALVREASRRTIGLRHYDVQVLGGIVLHQGKIAEMATWIRAARNLYYEAAWSVDHGKIDHALIAMAKWYCGEIAVRCANEAVQMHGGYGYIDEYKVQRLYRDAKILEIYEGTKEMEKGVISRAILG